MSDNEQTPEETEDVAGDDAGGQDPSERPPAGDDAGGQDPSERPRSAADIPQGPPSDAAPAADAPEVGEEEGEAPAAEEPEAVEEAAAPAAEEVAEKPKAKDQAPGADLEPIALEPERELSAEERARLEAEEEERARLEAEAEAGDEPVARSGPQVELAPDARIQATGKRKSSIARVILRPGSGNCQVNGRPLDEYFPRQALRTMARSPLLTAGYESSVDVHVRVHGGGIAGQAGAVRHGIARALTDVDPELRSELKRRGLLTRDARKKERRKAGLKKARKRPQFSKR